MRVAKLQVRIAMLAVMALAGSACQTAQKPAPLVPARTAPPLASTTPVPTSAPHQTAPATPTASTSQHPQVPAEPSAQTQTKTKPEPPPATPPPDAVAELIARVEK